MGQYEDIVYSNLENAQVETSLLQRLRSSVSRHRLAILLGSMWLLATAVVAIGYSQVQVTKARKLCNQYLYSPAQDAIDYDVQVFSSGFHEDISKYQGPPTPELDNTWEDLFFGVGFWITHDEAARLANATSRFGPTYPELYVITLDVFHQLHCLNTLRQVAYADQYGPDERPPHLEHVFEHNHLSHCVDSIRQSLMCNADVTPVVLQWDPEQQLNVWKGSMPHTCRRYDKIERWARERAIVSLDQDTGDWMDPDLSVQGLKVQIR